MRVIQNLANAPGACLLLGLVLALFSVFLARCLLGALLEMHRSKSALKKLRKEYSFWRRLCLRPVIEQGRHAPRFCIRLAAIHHIRAISIPVLILLWLLGKGIPFMNTVLAWAAVAGFLLLDLPVLVIESVLYRKFINRKKHKNKIGEWRFRKYHNTAEHEKLL